jgi:hypothetical protein
MRRELRIRTAVTDKSRIWKRDLSVASIDQVTTRVASATKRELRCPVK